VGADPAIQFRSVTKRFGDCVANAEVSFSVSAGSIHGLIGENGAGKSTAMKLLYGMYGVSSGEILLGGKAVEWKSPSDAIAAGIGMVHQHFMLADPYTALDNVLLGAEPMRAGSGWLPRFLRPIDRVGARKRLEDLSRRYGLTVPWDEPVSRISVGVQQRIEILKLLYRDARILILDEPTAVLTPQETVELFVNLRKLQAEGKTVIIITHKLKEVMSVTDRVTVMRAGRVTGEVDTSKTTPQELADLMVGRKVVLAIEAGAAKVREGASALVFERVVAEERASKRRLLDDVSFSVRAGEIVGIAGVEGNGQSELLQAVLHPSDPHCRASGTVRVLGAEANALDAAAIKGMGVGFIPEDRHREGLLLDASLVENFALGLHRDFSSYGLISWKRISTRAHAAFEEYDVRPRALDAQAGRLSGGNQQKVVIAREFERKPRLLIAAQPTRGVDVGAIEFIHRRIVRARDEGAGVLLVSSELDEITSLADRILVLYEGRIVGEFARGQAGESEIGLLMGGGHA